MVQVETASVSESEVIDQKANIILISSPETLTADDGYSKLARVKSWAKEGVALLTPALRLKLGMAAEARRQGKPFLLMPISKKKKMQPS